jgi:TM2 domain-containing membrane protein YozV
MAQDHGPQAAGVAILFLALSWIFVPLRCYCRIAIVRTFGREDYFSVVTQVILPLFDLRDIEAE